MTSSDRLSNDNTSSASAYKSLNIYLLPLEFLPYSNSDITYIDLLLSDFN